MSWKSIKDVLTTIWGGFSFNMKKDAHPFSPNEHKFIVRFLEIFMKECPKYGAFLNNLDLDKIEFYWAPNCNTSNGILGAFSLTEPNRFYLGVFYNDSVSIAKSLSCSSILDESIGITIIHELTHMFQFKVSPPLFVINRLVTLVVDKIPYVNRIGIEYDARVNSETPEVIEFLNTLNNVFEPYCASMDTIKHIKSKGKSAEHSEQRLAMWETSDEYPERYKAYAKELYAIANQ